MSDDYKVGYGKPPAKNKFQKGKSGNPNGRRRRRNRPEEPLDFQKMVIAEFKSLITINEAGNKKRVTKCQALLKAAFARALALQDAAMLKYLLNLMEKLLKEAFADEKCDKSGFSPHVWELFEKVEQDIATWNASEANNAHGGLS